MSRSRSPSNPTGSTAPSISPPAPRRRGVESFAPGGLYDIVVDPSTGNVVISANDRTVRVLDQGVEVASIAAPDWVLDLVVHPDGGAVFGVDYAANILRFDLLSGTLSASTTVQWGAQLTIDPEREQLTAVMTSATGALEARTMSAFDLTELGTAVLAEPAPFTTTAPVADDGGHIWLAFSNAGFVSTYRPDFGPTNTPPTAADQQLTTLQDEAVDMTLTGTDADEGQSLTFAVTDSPDHGTLTGDAPDLNYEPEAGFTGTDEFRFTASDGSATSADATVTIEVQAPASNTVDGFASVIAPGGDTVTFTLPVEGGGTPPVEVLVPPEHGVLDQNGTTFTYDPDPGYEGPDAFDVRVGDPGPAAVELTVPLLVTPSGRNAFVVNTLGVAADLVPGDGVCATANVVAPAVPPCTLRAAVEEANATTTLDEIWFGIPAVQADVNGRYLLQVPAAGIPGVTQPVVIDGTTQFGFDSSAREPVVVLRRGGNGCGICLRGGGSTVRGLSISGFYFGILVDSPDNVVEGNWIGYDGYTPGGNSFGVLVCDGPETFGCTGEASRTRIGGTTPAQRNVFGGNGFGLGGGGSIVLYSDDNLVVGNWVGLHPRPSNITRGCLGGLSRGQTPPPECSVIGIRVRGARNQIGGTSPSDRNIVSHTLEYAIFIDAADHTRVQGNFVGANAYRQRRLRQLRRRHRRRDVQLEHPRRRRRRRCGQRGRRERQRDHRRGLDVRDLRQPCRRRRRRHHAAREPCRRAESGQHCYVGRGLDHRRHRTRGSERHQRQWRRPRAGERLTAAHRRQPHRYERVRHRRGPERHRRESQNARHADRRAPTRRGQHHQRQPQRRRAHRRDGSTARRKPHRNEPRRHLRDTEPNWCHDRRQSG